MAIAKNFEAINNILVSNQDKKVSSVLAQIQAIMSTKRAVVKKLTSNNQVVALFDNICSQWVTDQGTNAVEFAPKFANCIESAKQEKEVKQAFATRKNEITANIMNDIYIDMAEAKKDLEKAETALSTPIKLEDGFASETEVREYLGALNIKLDA